MRLTRRGRALVWSLVFAAAFAFGVLTGPVSIDYSQPVPQVYDNRDLSRNTDRP